jgi:hypothetical protein
VALAPTPGVGKRTDAAKAAQQVMTLTIRGETRTLSLGSIAFSERMIVRKATGLPVEAFIGEDKFGLDTLMVLWWLAGRGTNPMLTLDRSNEQVEWSTLTEDDMDVSVDDGEDDDPES